MLSPYRTALIMPETQDNGFEMVFPAFHQKKTQISNCQLAWQFSHARKVCLTPYLNKKPIQRRQTIDTTQNPTIMPLKSSNVA